MEHAEALDLIASLNAQCKLIQDTLGVDTVHIFVTNYEADTGLTHRFDTGVGNHYARMGQISHRATYFNESCRRDAREAEEE